MGLETWSALPKIDIFIIWMIFIIIAVFGFLQGVAVGFMAAVIMFAVSCSRTEVVRHELTGKSYQSQVRRQPEHRQLLDRGGLSYLHPFIHYFSNLDTGFEWCEDEILKRKRMDLNRYPPPLEKQLETISPGVDSLSPLLDLLERQEVKPGVQIIRQGEASKDLFFIESGSVALQTHRSTGPPLCLEILKNRRIVGEVGFYLGKKRAASEITNEDSVIYRLSIDQLKRLENKIQKRPVCFIDLLFVCWPSGLPV
jgi:MFS superfamily sulfate permease-like transporter